MYHLGLLICTHMEPEDMTLWMELLKPIWALPKCMQNMELLPYCQQRLQVQMKNYSKHSVYTIANNAYKYE